MILDGGNPDDCEAFITLMKFAPDTRVWFKRKNSEPVWGLRNKKRSATPLMKNYFYTIGEENPNENKDK